MHTSSVVALTRWPQCDAEQSRNIVVGHLNATACAFVGDVTDAWYAFADYVAISGCQLIGRALASSSSLCICSSRWSWYDNVFLQKVQMPEAH
jgi:hypothetical protein